MEQELNEFFTGSDPKRVHKFLCRVVRAQSKSLGYKKRPNIRNMSYNYRKVFMTCTQPGNKYQHQYAVFAFVMCMLADNTATRALIEACPHRLEFFVDVRKMATLAIKSNFCADNAIYIVEQIHRFATMKWLTNCNTHDIDAVQPQRLPGHPGV